jgi:hypothetical protein
MTPLPRIERLEISVGGLSREVLIERLTAQRVLLNTHAETLLDSDAFDERPTETIMVTERTVGELGFAGGATLPQIFAASEHQGLQLCPRATGAYLRLALTEQPSSGDSVMSAGRAPADSLTIASAVLSPDDEYPKGFYLRVVDGQPWLRGYRCDDTHVWSPDDRFVFRTAR